MMMMKMVRAPHEPRPAMSRKGGRRRSDPWLTGIRTARGDRWASARVQHVADKDWEEECRADGEREVYAILTRLKAQEWHSDVKVWPNRPVEIQHQYVCGSTNQSDYFKATASTYKAIKIPSQPSQPNKCHHKYAVLNLRNLPPPEELPRHSLLTPLSPPPASPLAPAPAPPARPAPANLAVARALASAPQPAPHYSASALAPPA